MYCTKKITDDLVWIGGNDRRLALFEGVYSVPNGVSYNSYVLLDEKIVVFDTVDNAISDLFFENLEQTLKSKIPDYIIVHHMEPDHSAILKQFLNTYPQTTVVCNKKIQEMISQFFELKNIKYHIVSEGDILDTGRHKLTFVMAPMVHWPEVMVSYDITDKILFSADAFGTFGALNGAIFADEVDFEQNYLDEARRYYCNIVGKYGPQVQMLLKKASNLDIKYICPLHGFVWRYNINYYIDKYQKWSTYTPEENGVMIAYASVYGHTANVAEIMAAKLRDNGIKVVVYDVSVTPVSEIVAAVFKWSHLLFASTTYNAGIFISMEDLLRDLAVHNIQKRTVAFIENGSWAATSGKLMKDILSGCKDMTFIEKVISMKSSLKVSQENEIEELVQTIVGTFKEAEMISQNGVVNENKIEAEPFNKISYGLYLLTTNDTQKDNGCIVNTVQMLNDNPKRICFSVNKQNYSHDVIVKTKKINVSILTENIAFDVYKRFGFSSGRDNNKFQDMLGFTRSENGLLYMNDANAFMSANIEKIVDADTHTLFIATVSEARQLSTIPSVTYDYYFKHIKPKPQMSEEHKEGYICKICGYFYEGKVLPPDYICPLCKHGASDFEYVNQ